MVRNKDGDGIESSKIILEIQKRPCLYDTNDVFYGDRAEKMRNWEEVYECVVPGWAALGLAEKLVAGKEVQKRWRSIRDSYTKAYRQGKCTPPEQASNRRSQYHRQMAFLLRALQNKRPRYSQDKYESLSEVSSSPQHPPEDIRIQDIEKPLDLKTKPEKVYHDKECQVSFDDKTCVLPEDHFRDDKMFMNSLLPMFKKMSDDTRLLCRIEVLKIIRYALQGHKCFEDLKVAEDRFFKDSMSGILAKEEKEKMTTRSENGRPIRKRKTRSPSPSPIPVKKRGPGRPRKIRPPESDDEQYKKVPKVPKLAPKLVPNLVPKVEPEDEYGYATTINQLPMPTFMKMLNLERSSTSQVQIKTEPVDEVQ
ncbi:uncharacterized protein LOC121738177 [Aricia agestis]|uniref:uncharacterized protein LOC121738177 n=1 Tax=Aricia agestis TaxID=91739 RepID=UPI001C205E7C|nr:uncharacterized protein LOC121738177 [Aricia agestis]